MAIDLRQNGDGSAGLQGSASGAGGVNSDGEFVLDGRSWNASSVTSASFVTSRDYVLKAVMARIETSGTDAGAVTAQLFMAPSGTALSAGTALTATINLKTTALTHITATLSAVNQRIPAGYAVGVVFAGVMTAASGGLSVSMCPA